MAESKMEEEVCRASDRGERGLCCLLDVPGKRILHLSNSVELYKEGGGERDNEVKCALITHVNTLYVYIHKPFSYSTFLKTLLLQHIFQEFQN